MEKTLGEASQALDRIAESSLLEVCSESRSTHTPFRRIPKDRGQMYWIILRREDNTEVHGSISCDLRLGDRSGAKPAITNFGRCLVAEAIEAFSRNAKIGRSEGNKDSPQEFPDLLRIPFHQR